MDESLRPTGLYHVKWEEFGSYRDPNALSNLPDPQDDTWYERRYSVAFTAENDEDAIAKVEGVLNDHAADGDHVFTAYREEYNSETDNILLVRAFTEENL